MTGSDEQLKNQSLYDVWFRAEVEKGMESAEKEIQVDHDDVVKEARAVIALARKQNASQVV
jgi:hypothetical protein